MAWAPSSGESPERRAAWGAGRQIGIAAMSSRAASRGAAGSGGNQDLVSVGEGEHKLSASTGLEAPSFGADRHERNSREPQPRPKKAKAPKPGASERSQGSSNLANLRLPTILPPVKFESGFSATALLCLAVASSALLGVDRGSVCVRGPADKSWQSTATSGLGSQSQSDSPETSRRPQNLWPTPPFSPPWIRGLAGARLTEQNWLTNAAAQ